MLHFCSCSPLCFSAIAVSKGCTTTLGAEHPLELPTPPSWLPIHRDTPNPHHPHANRPGQTHLDKELNLRLFHRPALHSRDRSGGTQHTHCCAEFRLCSAARGCCTSGWAGIEARPFLPVRSGEERWGARRGKLRGLPAVTQHASIREALTGPQPGYRALPGVSITSPMGIGLFFLVQEVSSPPSGSFFSPLPEFLAAVPLDPTDTGCECDATMPTLLQWGCGAEGLGKRGGQTRLLTTTSSQTALHRKALQNTHSTAPFPEFGLFHGKDAPPAFLPRMPSGGAGCWGEPSNVPWCRAASTSFAQNGVFIASPFTPAWISSELFCKQSVNEESFLLLLSTRQPFPSSPALNDRTCAGTQPAARVYPGHKQKAGCRLGTPLPSFICCTALKNTSSAPSGTCPCAVPAAQSGPSRSAVHRRTHCHCCASPRPGASCCRD